MEHENPYHPPEAESNAWRSKKSDPRFTNGLRLLIAAPVVYGLGWAGVALIQVYLLHLPFAETLGGIAYFSSVLPIIPGIIAFAGVALIAIGGR
jgi:hypothetical protein